MNRLFRSFVPALVTMLLFGCGGAGGSNTGQADAGAGSLSYKLVLGGNFVEPVSGIQFGLVLPAGAVLQVETGTTSVLPASLCLSGKAPADAILAASYASGSATIAVASASCLVAGEFATLTLDLASGSAAPGASDFTVQNLVAVDAQGATLSGITVTLQ